MPSKYQLLFSVVNHIVLLASIPIYNVNLFRVASLDLTVFGTEVMVSLPHILGGLGMTHL